jgi:hypothetical protein
MDMKSEHGPWYNFHEAPFVPSNDKTRKRRTTSRTDFGIENALLIKIYPEVVTNSVLPIFCYIYIILYYYIKN